jgi:hypothetical protein
MACYGLCESCSNIDFLSWVYDIKTPGDESSEISRNVNRKAGWSGANPMPFEVEAAEEPGAVVERSDFERESRIRLWMRAIGAHLRIVGNCMRYGVHHVPWWLTTVGC